MLCRLLLPDKLACRMEKHKREAFCPVFVMYFRPYPVRGLYLSDPAVYGGEKYERTIGE